MKEVETLYWPVAIPGLENTKRKGGKGVIFLPLLYFSVLFPSHKLRHAYMVFILTRLAARDAFFLRCFEGLLQRPLASKYVPH